MKMGFLLGKKLFSRAALLSCGACFCVLGTSEITRANYCRPFNPSMTYLTVAIPCSDPAVSGELNCSSKLDIEDLRYAALNNFIEQLTISTLARNDSSFEAFQTMTLERSLTFALGFGGIGTRLVEPGYDSWDPSEVDIQLIDTEDAFVFTDAPNIIFFSTGLLENLVEDVVIRHFGSLQGYKKHLLEITEGDVLWNLYPEDDVKLNGFPIGKLYFQAHSYASKNPLKMMWSFSRELVGGLMFIGAHETAHIRNNDSARMPETCKEFENIERRADEFAADVFTEFNFNMNPDNADAAENADVFSFLKYFKETGLSGVDTVTGCTYTRADVRLKHVHDYYREDFYLLQSVTFSAADFTTGTPTESICKNMEGFTWRQSVE